MTPVLHAYTCYLARYAHNYNILATYVDTCLFFMRPEQMLTCDHVNGMCEYFVATKRSHG